MNIKRVVISVLTLAVMVSQMAGCAFFNQNELSDMINSGRQVVLEVTVPNNGGTVLGKQQSDVEWIQLDQISSYSDFRSEFDNILNINKITFNGVNSKQGCIYIDSDGNRNGNVCLNDGFRNKYFVENYWNDTDIQKQIAEAVDKAYTDLDKASDKTKLMASINAYYDIFQDGVNPNSFNGSQSITRNQFMTAMYKTSTPVNMGYLNGVDENNAFVKATGGKVSKYSAFSYQVATLQFLDYNNGSLNSSNIDKSMTRGEAIYSIVKRYFSSEYDKFDPKEDSGFKDVKNGGDLTGGDKDKKKWQLYTLAYMLDKQNGNVQEELYKALALANKLGIVKPDENGDSRWNEAISKEEAVALFINSQLALDKAKGYKTEDNVGKYEPNLFKIQSGMIIDDLNKATVHDEKTDSETGNKTGTADNGEAIAKNSDNWAEQEGLPESSSSSSSSSSSKSSTSSKPSSSSSKPKASKPNTINPVLPGNPSTNGDGGEMDPSEFGENPNGRGPGIAGPLH